MELIISLGFGWGLWLWIDGWRHPRSRAGSRVQRSSRADQLLAAAGMPAVRASRLWLLCAVLAVATGLGVYVMTSLTVLAIIAGFAASVAPWGVLRSRAIRRRRDHAEAWPDAIDHLASGIRAGLSLPEALIGLAERGPENLQPAFARFGRDYQSTGRFAESLDRLKDRLADPIGDRVIEALRIAREVGGGDIGRMLRTLSTFLREDVRTRAELEARQSWTVSGARLAVAAPWLVLAMMVTRPDAREQFTTHTGTLVIVVGAVVCFVAYRLMMRVGRLPEPERVLV